ncbi:MAG: hypothetical protein K6T16_02980 [Candidatus Pacearchaeota archaeon]|nr:hypothetical protein [Candidatus Pacearchaeota archaeon]
MAKTLKDAIIEGTKNFYFLRKNDNAIIKVYSLETFCNNYPPNFKAFEIKTITPQGYIPSGPSPFDIPVTEPELNKYEIISLEKAVEILSQKKP